MSKIDIKSKVVSITDNVGAQAKKIVVVLAAGCFLRTSSWIPMYYIVGGFLNGMLAKILKAIIRQPRPIQSKSLGYGMPSSHSQVIFYFVTVISWIFCSYNHYVANSFIPIILTYGFALTAMYVVFQTIYSI